MSRMSLTTNMQNPKKKEKSKDKEDRAKVGKSPKDSQPAKDNIQA